MGKAARQRQTATAAAAPATTPVAPPPLVVPIPAPAMAELAALYVEKERAVQQFERSFRLALLTLGQDPSVGVWSMDTDACTATRQRPPAIAKSAGTTSTPPPPVPPLGDGEEAPHGDQPGESA